MEEYRRIIKKGELWSLIYGAKYEVKQLVISNTYIDRSEIQTIIAAHIRSLR